MVPGLLINPYLVRNMNNKIFDKVNSKGEKFKNCIYFLSKYRGLNIT